MTRIATVADVEEVLALIAGYQRFYGADPDDDRNRAFFARFCPPGGPYGVLLRADGPDGRACGFACVYWTQESVSATDIAVLHDLFVAPEARRTGAGRLLLDAAVAAARSHGAASLSWMTALDNRRAQRLYDSYEATRDAWFEYSIEL